MEVAAFDHRGEAWRLSTVQDWSFVGASMPSAEVGDKLKQICRQILEVVFHSPP